MVFTGAGANFQGNSQRTAEKQTKEHTYKPDQNPIQAKAKGQVTPNFPYAQVNIRK